MIVLIVLTLRPVVFFCICLYQFIQKMVTYWSHGKHEKIDYNAIPLPMLLYNEHLN